MGSDDPNFGLHVCIAKNFYQLWNLPKPLPQSLNSKVCVCLRVCVSGASGHWGAAMAWLTMVSPEGQLLFKLLVHLHFGCGELRSDEEQGNQQ